MRPIKEGDIVYIMFSDDEEQILEGKMEEYCKARVLHMPADVGDFLYIEYLGNNKDIVALNPLNINFVGMCLIQEKRGER